MEFIQLLAFILTLNGLVSAEHHHKSRKNYLSPSYYPKHYWYGRTPVTIEEIVPQDYAPSIMTNAKTNENGLLLELVKKLRMFQVVGNNMRQDLNILLTDYDQLLNFIISMNQMYCVTLQDEKLTAKHVDGARILTKLKGKRRNLNETLNEFDKLLDFTPTLKHKFYGDIKSTSKYRDVPQVMVQGTLDESDNNKSSTALPNLQKSATKTEDKGPKVEKYDQPSPAQ